MVIYNGPTRRPSFMSIRPRTSPGIFISDSALSSSSFTEPSQRSTQDLGANLGPEPHNPHAVHLSHSSQLPDTPPLEEASEPHVDYLDGDQYCLYAQQVDGSKRGIVDSATTSVRTLVRRASNSMRSLRAAKSRKGSRDASVDALTQSAVLELFAQEQQASQCINGSSAPSHRPESSLKQLKRTFSRKERRSAFSLPTGHNANNSNDVAPLPDVNELLRNLETPYNTEGGAQARAAAAASRSNISTFKQKLNDLPHSRLCRHTSGYADSVVGSDADLPIVSGGSSSSTCASSMDAMEEAQFQARRPPKDPVPELPTELILHIFSFLDRDALVAAEAVSRRWNAVASTSQAWRRVFLAAFSPRQPVSQSPLPMGGLGLGPAPYPAQDWKKMYEARQKVEKNWTQSKPKAVYFSGHTDSVYCCQFDEEKMITGSRDRTIRVWNLRTYQCEKVIGGPATRPVLPPIGSLPLEVHPTATISAIASLNGTAKGNGLYHIPTEYHSASILCLQFDKQIMVTGSSDSTCIMWDINTYQPIRRLRAHTMGVLDVCFDANYIVSCSKDHTICVWDRETGDLLRILKGHRGPVNAVQLRGNLLVSASGDGMAKLWNLQNIRDPKDTIHAKDFASQDRGLAAVEFSDDARYVLAGGNDHVIYKFDANTGALVHTYEGHTQLVRSLFLDSSNNRVLSGSYDQGMRVFEFETGRQIAQYDNWTTSWILAAKSDYRRIVCTSQDGRAVLMDFGVTVPNVHLLDGRGQQ